MQAPQVSRMDESSREQKFLGANTLENESSREWKFPGQFAPGSKCTYQGAKVTGSKLVGSYWNFRSRKPIGPGMKRLSTGIMI